MDTIYFLLAVAATSAAIFALTTRADRLSDRISGRRASSDGDSSRPGISSINDEWTASWFGPTHSADISGSWDSGGSSSIGDRGGLGGGSRD